MGALRKLAEYDSSIAKDNAYEVTRLVFFFFLFIYFTYCWHLCMLRWQMDGDNRKKKKWVNAKNYILHWRVVSCFSVNFNKHTKSHITLFLAKSIFNKKTLSMCRHHLQQIRQMRMNVFTMCMLHIHMRSTKLSTCVRHHVH